MGNLICSKTRLLQATWIALAIVAAYSVNMDSFAADTQEQKPILGIATLGQTTFNELKANLSKKKCLVMYSKNEVAASDTCFNLPGDPYIYFNSYINEAEADSDYSEEMVKGTENNVVVSVEIPVVSDDENVCKDYFSSLEKSWGAPVKKEPSGTIWQSGSVQVRYSGQGSSCHILYQSLEAIHANESSRESKSKENREKLDSLL